MKTLMLVTMMGLSATAMANTVQKTAFDKTTYKATSTISTNPKLMGSNSEGGSFVGVNNKITLVDGDNKFGGAPTAKAFIKLYPSTPSQPHTQVAVDLKRQGNTQTYSGSATGELTVQSGLPENISSSKIYFLGGNGQVVDNFGHGFDGPTNLNKK